MSERENLVPGREETGRDDESSAFAEDSAKAKDSLTKLAADMDELKQTLMRRQADFENYRKRIEKERSEDTQRTTARLIEGLIPVVDGFEHALAAHRDPAYEGYKKGFEIIYKQLLEHLRRLGAEREDPTGRAFDPHLHQAMERTETTEQEDGQILEVFQPGYVFHGRVLRPAMVRVAVRPAAASKQAVN